jgi:outer membrane receptor protein involved in Fe transport
MRHKTKAFPTMTRQVIWFISFLMLGFAGTGFAQGVQTGTLRGTVRDQSGLAVPGATVTVTSPALQGQRAVVTASDGSFTFQALPPGAYEAHYELQGFSPVTNQINVPLGGVVEQTVTLRAAGITEEVLVTAETPAPIATPVVGANYKHEEIELLATPRTLEGIAQLSPALSENTPNNGQVAINGAFAFDNVFMLNGVDVNDNLFGSPQNLFIEDAIQETQILTSGVSAEYGRFTGGVVNAITKSGGNTFSGSLRVNFQNPSWSKVTPYEVLKTITRPNTLQESYEGTFGGPIVKDKLWFFGAGRFASLSVQQTLAQTGLAVLQDDKNKRGEVKVTGTVAANHTIQAGYLNNSRQVSNTSGLFGFAIAPVDLVTRSLPNWYYFTNYRGTLKNNFLIEAQYSERRFRFQGDGGTSTNIFDSPIFTNHQTAAFYNAPYFDANDQEQRNNRQLTGSATYFLEKAGRHEIKAGYEFFRSQRTGGNSQSSTSYVFNADYATDAAGNPIFDSTGNLSPVFVPGDTTVDFFPATRGATLNVDSNSLYLQDHWAVNRHWSADVGARFERVKASSTGNIISASNTSRIVPRLAAAYDVAGNGDHVIHVTYAWYSGRYNEAQIGANSPVGNPADINTTYQGPAGQGKSFAPGFDIKNYPVDANASVSVPTANIFVDPNLKSPVVREFTTSYGVNIFKNRGYAEGSYVHRRTVDIIEDFISTAEGFTHVVADGIDAGLVTNHVLRNTDLASRVYDALVFQSRYRITNSWSVNGHYTVELRNNGNYEGEGTNQPGSLSRIGDYPEVFSASRSFPDGRLQDFQKHRLRLWSIYNFSMGRFGDLSVSGLVRVDSGQVYSLTATNVSITGTQKALLRAAGYPDSPSPQTVYFGERGSQEFPGYGLLDASVNYNIPVLRTLRPWLKFDVYNLLNNQTLIGWNKTVRIDPNSPKDSLGLGTGFIQGSLFGQAQSANNFPLAFNGQNGGRTFRVAVGFRF